MSDEFRVEVRYKAEVSQTSVFDAELDLIASVLPELIHLAQQYDDSDDE